MNKRIRTLTLVAVSVLVLGVVGSAFGGRGVGESVTPAPDEAGYGGDEVTNAIDAALGRPQTAIGAEPKSVGVTSLPAPAAADRSASKSGSGEAAAGSIGASEPVASSLGSVDDRKIVQTASMRLQVKDVGGSFEEIGRIATGAGGFVASSNFALQGEQQIASVTIRVPASRYQDVLSQVRALGAKVDAEASNASDVTEEYSDLSARLRTLEATEAQLLQFLAQAKNIAEVLQVQDRLNSVRSEIERVKGRMALLDKLSDLATLTVHLRPVVGAAKTATTGGHDFGAEITKAWESSLDFLGGIAIGVLTVVVFSWWVLPLGLPAAWLLGRWLRGRPQPAAPAAYD